MVTMFLAIGVNGLVGNAQTTVDIAKAWAQGLTAAQRAEAGKQLETLRPEFQRELIKVMPFSEQVEVSRGRFEAFLQARSNLSAEKRAAVEAVISLSYALTTPELVEANQTLVEATFERLGKV
jgi:hypothetical protein